MKKILAILLVGVMSVTAFGFNASAVEKTDAEIQQEKLGYILNLNKDIWLDCAVIYDGVWPSIMDNAREVYDTDGLSADEYTVALKQVMICITMHRLLILNMQRLHIKML